MFSSLLMVDVIKTSFIGLYHTTSVTEPIRYIILCSFFLHWRGGIQSAKTCLKNSEQLKVSIFTTNEMENQVKYV